MVDEELETNYDKLQFISKSVSNLISIEKVLSSGIVNVAGQEVALDDNTRSNLTTEFNNLVSDIKTQLDLIKL